MSEIAISEAKARLTALVRQAEAGEDVVLTRNGKGVARITSMVPRRLTVEERMAVIRKAQALVGDLPPDFDAARSQDFLYDEDGLPA
ncbi:type II toxin-antitoxin system Phd/YefM family antitoxin [Brevundimonas sp.]|jgi:prevent-host-death family protein|uniref:type II toxin-antitoxin system Phd/YefM family antitoxin n=1 Tax=Brevundimonas sp. TaxID=1871086 RepID=UPI002623D38E|nr:type II toxin-antitoxin system prevent-host-death family antitoxin [Brevundimonas sp.]